MRFFLLIILLAPGFFYSLAQTTCTPILDTLTVRQIAMENSSGKSKVRLMRSSVEFKTDSCQWVVTTSVIRIAHRFVCRRLNGCRLEILRTWVIDDQTGIVVRKEKQRKLLPNYE